MASIPFRVPKRCQTFGKQKNQRHAPCPLKLNRTAVGLTGQIHIICLTTKSPGLGAFRVVTFSAANRLPLRGKML
jgi:hypothetical protein